VSAVTLFRAARILVAFFRASDSAVDAHSRMVNARKGAEAEYMAESRPFEYRLTACGKRGWALWV
jgi:hypothetical protein